MRIFQRIWRHIAALRVDIVHLLLGMNLLGFIVTFLMTDRLERELGLDSAEAAVAALRICGGNDTHLIWAGQLHRWLVSCFLHGGPWHLAFNCWFLFQVGRVARDAVGPRRFFILFLLGGLGGSVCSTISGSWPMILGVGVDELHPRISVGASGALFSIIGFLLAYLRRSDEVLSRMWKQQLVFCLIVNIVLGLTMPSIDNAAHFGGFVVGWFMESVMRREGQWHGGFTNSRLTAAGLTVVLLLCFGAAVFDQQTGFGMDFERRVKRDNIERAVLRIVRDLESESPRPYSLSAGTGMRKAIRDLEAAETGMRALDITTTDRVQALENLVEVYKAAARKPDAAPRGVRIAAQRRFLGAMERLRETDS